jgi:hypothetical protein
MSFSPEGDFVIVDSYLKKVCLFTPLFNLIKVISVALTYPNRYEYGENNIMDGNVKLPDINKVHMHDNSNLQVYIYTCIYIYIYIIK